MKKRANNPVSILAALKAGGGRTTRVRTAVVESFAAERVPLTAMQLASTVAERGIDANKTTLYREIAHLLAKGVLQEVRLGDRAVRYELKDDGHHHHVVCMKCDAVVDVDLERDLDAQEKRIAKETGFLLIRHSLEFFGLCASCR